MSAQVALQEVRIRVECDEKTVGHLVFSGNKVLRGAKKLKKIIGVRQANAVVLIIMGFYMDKDEDFGTFEYGNKTYSFTSETMEESLKRK